MPHVYFDSKKRRWFCELRTPNEVLAISDAARKKKHTFPQSVDRETASDLSVDIIRTWRAEWATITGPRIVRVPVQSYHTIVMLPHTITRGIMGTVPVEVWPGDPIPESVPCPRPVEPEIAAPVVDYEDMITLEQMRKNRTDKATKARRTGWQKFFTFLGRDDRDMATITTDDCIRYINALIEQERAGEFESKTVENRMNDVRALYTFAISQQKLIENPAKHPGCTYKGFTREENKKDWWTDDEAARVVTEAARSTDPVIRWGNLVAYFCGARNAELFEATTRDVEVQTDGTVVLHVRMQNRDAKKQRLKTGEISKRRFPIHSVVAADFLAYKQSLPEGPLFPMIRLDSEGRRNDNGTNIVNKWLHDVIGTDKTFYYHRHNMKTRLRGLVEEDIRDYLAGHAGGKIGRDYGFYPIPVLREAIEKIADPRNG